MLLFASATQGWFLTRNKWWDTVALLLIAFTLFRPAFGWILPPRLIAPYRRHRLLKWRKNRPPIRCFACALAARNFPPEKSLQQPWNCRLANRPPVLNDWNKNAGIAVREEDDKILIDTLTFGGPAEAAGLDLDWEILALQEPDNSRPPKQIFWLPALALLALIIFLQRRRIRQ